MIRARMVTFGRFPFEDIEGAGSILLWGHNPSHSDPPKSRRILEAVRAGTELITINPKRIPLANQGKHLKPRPGSDLAIALAMINIIVTEGLYDREFVAKYALGFDRIVEHVKQYTPEWAAELSWVSAEDIREVARTFATKKPGCIIQGTCALGQQEAGFQISRAFSILQTITGSIYGKGSWIRVPMPYWPRLDYPLPEGQPVGTEDYPIHWELWGRNFGEGQGISLPNAILDGKPYPIEMVFLNAGNFVLTQADSQRFREAFQKLEMFVVMDVRMTETAKLAHIVLPAATFLEKTGLGYSYAVTQGIPYLCLRPKVVEPPGECWSEFKFWTTLAQRMGYGNYFPWRTEEEYVDYEVKDMNLSTEKMRAMPTHGLLYGETKYGQEALGSKPFPTPSQKIELYSDTLEKLGYHPMPTYYEPTVSPVTAPGVFKEYPLILVSGDREAQFSHSQMREIQKLRARAPEPVATVHPDTAREQGLADGDMVEVESQHAAIKLRLKTSVDIMPGVISIPHGWAEANVNELTSTQHRDPVTGIPHLKGILVRARKA
ncbi:MAG: molybdopterin-dependent oxidoreductase [Chloroflexi bacterium]|nr:molybdopterin-dependent oxidoreductase [Chloroflexota bacterium]